MKGLLIVAALFFVLRGSAGVCADDPVGSCDDTRLSCYAFCNDGQKQKNTTIGRCYNWRTAQCDVEQCDGNPCDRANNGCSDAFTDDKSCVVLTANWYATWCNY